MKGVIKSATKVVSRALKGGGTSGGITRTQSERILLHWRGKTSLYDCVRLYKNGVGEKFSVHRLVAEYFLNDWDPELEVNHIDGNRYNNAAENLEMCTHQRNMEHAIANDRKNDYGEKSRNAKLTNAQAERIRERYYAGGITQLELAIKFGVSHQTVSCIVRHKKYIR